MSFACIVNNAATDTDTEIALNTMDDCTGIERERERESRACGHAQMIRDASYIIMTAEMTQYTYRLLSRQRKCGHVIH